MRDEIIKAAMADPENYYEDGVLYGPGTDGDRVELARFSPEMTKRYTGPVPYWLVRRGFKIYDVVGNRYEPTTPAMVITPDGLRPVDDSARVWTWAEIEDDYEDRDMFFDGLVKFVF